MYILDKDSNQLINAEQTTFKEQKLKERQHLQEWIAKNPEVLGEELLVIQKEFDGFSDTHERLDLLALDKGGKLVVIENKLDDSGRDVTWQAIKYASYCSSMTQEEIVSVFAKYLNGTEENAKEKILSFFDKEDMEDIDLNPENSQRIIFVAANFRKEVTSSALWLRNFGIDICCIKVSPYMYNGKIMVEFDQIIPIKEAEEYTIKIAEKKKVESQKAENKKRSENGRLEFWQQFVEYNKQKNGPYAASTPNSDSWMGKGGVGIGGASVNIIISRMACRTEIYVNTGVRETNKRIYDFFYSYKDTIEAELGAMKWERLDDKVTCRISQSKDLSYLQEEQWQEMFDLFISNTEKYIAIFSKVARKYKK